MTSLKNPVSVRDHEGILLPHKASFSEMVYQMQMMRAWQYSCHETALITDKSYFIEYKLSENYTGVQTQYAQNFMGYIGFTSQLPIVIFHWANIFVKLLVLVAWSPDDQGSINHH